jgi:hypothetical protein
VGHHQKSGNFTEAAEALLLHAKLYKFVDEKLGEISGLNFPGRKERRKREGKEEEEEEEREG